MVEDLEDLFATPHIRDDKSLSTEGVEEFFDVPAEEIVDDGLALDTPVASIHDLLSSLSADLKKLAEDIHKLLEDEARRPAGFTRIAAPSTDPPPRRDAPG